LVTDGWIYRRCLQIDDYPPIGARRNLVIGRVAAVVGWGWGTYLPCKETRTTCMGEQCPPLYFLVHR
jgi:hypothetical protein